VSDPPIQGLRRWIVSEAEHFPASEATQAPGPGDEKEPEGAHAAEEVGVGALPGPVPSI
jgi:hypothetical protein